MLKAATTAVAIALQTNLIFAADVDPVKAAIAPTCGEHEVNCRMFEGTLMGSGSAEEKAEMQAEMAATSFSLTDEQHQTAKAFLQGPADSRILLIHQLPGKGPSVLAESKDLTLSPPPPPTGFHELGTPEPQPIIMQSLEMCIGPGNYSWAVKGPNPTPTDTKFTLWVQRPQKFDDCGEKKTPPPTPPLTPAQNASSTKMCEALIEVERFSQLGFLASLLHKLKTNQLEGVVQYVEKEIDRIQFILDKDAGSIMPEGIKDKTPGGFQETTLNFTSPYYDGDGIIQKSNKTIDVQVTLKQKENASFSTTPTSDEPALPVDSSLPSFEQLEKDQSSSSAYFPSIPTPTPLPSSVNADNGNSSTTDIVVVALLVLVPVMCIVCVFGLSRYSNKKNKKSGDFWRPNTTRVEAFLIRKNTGSGKPMSSKKKDNQALLEQQNSMPDVDVDAYNMGNLFGSVEGVTQSRGNLQAPEHV